MTYNRTERRAHLDALRVRQQIAQAEAELAEKELAEILGLERALARLQRRRENARQELLLAQERTTWARKQAILPPPIHGGPAGLRAAAAEIAAWNAQHRDAA